MLLLRFFSIIHQAVVLTQKANVVSQHATQQPFVQRAVENAVVVVTAKKSPKRNQKISVTKKLRQLRRRSQLRQTEQRQSVELLKKEENENKRQVKKKFQKMNQLRRTQNQLTVK